MKVLRLGNSIKYECKSCKSLLLIDSSDWESPKGSGFDKTYVRCPICGDLIYKDFILDEYNNEKSSNNHVLTRDSKSEKMILETGHDACNGWTE